MPWPSEARAGQRVICIDNRRLTDVLFIGREYEIADTRIADRDQATPYGRTCKDHVLVSLAGVSNPKDYMFGFAFFDARRFKPVTRTRTEEEAKRLSDIGLSKIMDGYADERVKEVS